MFNCTKCGQCCRNLNFSPLYKHLDRGDGICKYLDNKSSLCTIYKNRPIECNIETMYECYFSKNMSKEEYYQLNYAACKKFQKNNF